MFKYLLSTYYYFYFLPFIFKVSPKLFSGKLNIVFDTLSNNLSYRLPDSAKKDLFISFRELKRLIFQNLNGLILPKIESNSAIYDTNEASYNLRKKYLSKFYTEKDYSNISKDNLIKFLPVYAKVFLFILLLLNSIPTFLINLFKNNKLKNGLKVRQFAECVSLLYLCKKNNISKVYYFNIYEPDSNITSYLLNKIGIETILITSEVPLHFGNTKMIGSEINFCFGYQLEEYEIYKNTIFTNKIKLLIPETVIDTANHYLNNDFNTVKNTIGFISSGMWLRKILGDADSGLNELENENLIINYLKEYLLLNSSTKLIIYLHPIEKKKESFELTNAHYKSIFNETDVTFAPLNTSSALSFNNSDVCIALYSTLLYERIFMGFKSIIMPLGIKNFPIPQSSLDKCSAKSKDELFEKLNYFLNLSNEKYIDYIGFENKYYKKFETIF